MDGELRGVNPEPGPIWERSLPTRRQDPADAERGDHAREEELADPGAGWRRRPQPFICAVRACRRCGTGPRARCC